MVFAIVSRRERHEFINQATVSFAPRCQLVSIDQTGKANLRHMANTGELDKHSRTVGQGTSFFIQLPIGAPIRPLANGHAQEHEANLSH